MEKPLLRATPVRDIPKSTPRLNPPLHFGSFFRRRALGGSSPKEIALVLAEDKGRETGALVSFGKVRFVGGKNCGEPTNELCAGEGRSCWCISTCLPDKGKEEDIAC